mmetsp:Transcript_85045/g.168764  ORF Transcript_85045/g.168764 Transcript_85045/m.168764 type:complete len:106 (+) Transcript_85045:591-908(+)
MYGTQTKIQEKSKEVTPRVTPCISGLKQPSCQMKAPMHTPSGTETISAVSIGWQKLASTPKTANPRALKPAGCRQSGASRAKERPQQQVVKISVIPEHLVNKPIR